jgi:hypothetical protein
LLKQTLEASYDPGALLLNGPNVRFTSADQFLSRLAQVSPTDNFTVKLEIGGIWSHTCVFEKPPNKGIELVEVVHQDQEESLTLRPEMSHKEIALVIPKSISDIQKGLVEKEKESLEWRVGRMRCHLGLVLESVDRMNSTSFPFFITPGNIEPHIRKLIHVPGLRGNPERTYKTTAIGAEFPGTFENYVASIINHWQVTQDHRLKGLERALETLGLTWKVYAQQVDDTQVELHVGRLPYGTQEKLRDTVSIADVGFGMSQALPVLVALLAAEPGQLVYLEQPEIHLHPRAKAGLAEVLAEAAIRGVHLVAETHSALLLLAIQSLVAEGKLSSDLVKLHWFKRRDDGATEVYHADLDESGAFGDWPEDFADVELEWQSRYLNAAELRQNGR